MKVLRRGQLTEWWLILRQRYGEWAPRDLFAALKLMGFWSNKYLKGETTSVSVLWRPTQAQWRYCQLFFFLLCICLENEFKHRDYELIDKRLVSSTCIFVMVHKTVAEDILMRSSRLSINSNGKLFFPSKPGIKHNKETVRTSWWQSNYLLCIVGLCDQWHRLDSCSQNQRRTALL